MIKQFLITVTNLETKIVEFTMKKTLKKLIGSDLEKYNITNMLKNQSIATTDEIFFKNNLIVITRIA